MDQHLQRKKSKMALRLVIVHTNKRPSPGIQQTVEERGKKEERDEMKNDRQEKIGHNQHKNSHKNAIFLVYSSTYKMTGEHRYLNENRSKNEPK